MQIHITAGDAVLQATLLENATAREVIGHLPLTLTLTDYAGTEKISQLPERLQTTNAPPGVKPQSGDITYYAPWGNLAIFYSDYAYSTGLIKLGTIEAGLEELAARQEDFTVSSEP